jgi:uncharacterized membrane protein YjfL (UPF0719 family)
LGNWDFDDNEVVFFLIAGLAGLAGTWAWYARLLRHPAPPCHPIRPALICTPILALAALLIVLTRWADPKYVVGQLDYQLLFLAGGATWLWVIAWSTRLLGVSVIDDAIERSNPAAAIAICGALFGSMAIYAGSNIGAGPTIWTTILPGFVATVVWLLLWLLVELVSRPSEAIAVDRDIATAVRHAGWLIATGVILGRSVAGDWTSWRETFADLAVHGWPVILFSAATVVMNWTLRPSPERPQPRVTRAGVIPVAILLAVAVGYVIWVGRPDIGQHIVTYEQYMKSQ